MFVMYRSPQATAKWLLGVPQNVKGKDLPDEVLSLKRVLQYACARFEITHRRTFHYKRTCYKIAEPDAKHWFECRYQTQEAQDVYASVR